MKFPRGLAAAFVICRCTLSAADAVPSSTAPAGPLRLFLDCQQGGCDFDYLRSQLGWVDWVRNREDAQVHVVVTYQPTGSGGGRYTLRLLGLERFKGVEDEIACNAPAKSTPDEVRQGMARQLTLGLMRYAAHLPVADRINVSLSPAAEEGAAPQAKRDPWNAWVFRISGSGSYSGETMSSTSNTFASLGASRITEDSLFRSSLYGYWTRSRYGSETYPMSTYEANMAWATAISPHWTYGLIGSGTRSESSNLDPGIKLSPGIEYNVWKYSESSKRQLTFLYMIGVAHNRYAHETIYSKTRETLYDNSLNIALDLNQPWGTVTAACYASAYLHDTAKNRLGVYVSMDIRVAKGLSLNFYGRYTRVRNQLALSAADITEDDYKLRLRELPTEYRYSASIGLSFSFGSLFNNAVNSRFRSAGDVF